MYLLIIRQFKILLLIHLKLTYNGKRNQTSCTYASLQIIWNKILTKVLLQLYIHTIYLYINIESNILHGIPG